VIWQMLMGFLKAPIWHIACCFQYMLFFCSLGQLYVAVGTLITKMQGRHEAAPIVQLAKVNVILERTTTTNGKPVLHGVLSRGTPLSCPTATHETLSHNLGCQNIFTILEDFLPEPELQKKHKLFLAVPRREPGDCQKKFVFFLQLRLRQKILKNRKYVLTTQVVRECFTCLSDCPSSLWGYVVYAGKSGWTDALSLDM